MLRSLSIAFCLSLAVSFSQKAPAQTSETNSLGMELRLLEGGRFVMGSDARERGLENAFPLSANSQFFGNPEYPAHVTWITKPFWIGKTEVTLAQWKKFIAETNYETTAGENGKGIIGWSPTPEDAPLYQSHDFERKPEFTWKNPGFPQEDDHPVVGVSWEDVQAFLKWLSKKEGVTYRLPSEAEWEYACRAGSDTWFSFGDRANGVIHEHANIGNVELEKHRKHSVERQWLINWDTAPSDGHVFTSTAGSFKANPFGLHDMHGNVWEWCQDLWLDTYYKRFDWPTRGEPRLIATDPVNESEPQTDANQFRTIRGGSWYNGPVICRSSNRAAWDAQDSAAYVGFRVVKEADHTLSTTALKSYSREKDAKEQVRKAGGLFYSLKGLDLEIRFEGETLPIEVLTLLKDIPDLQRLILAHKNKVKLSTEAFTALSQLQSLRRLEFRGPVLMEETDFSPLAELPQLEELIFSRSQAVTDKTLSQLGTLRSLTRFEAYGAGGSITDSGVRHLAGNFGLTHLKLFEVDTDGSFLASFAKAPLTELAITGRSGSKLRLTHDNAKHLERFPELTHLFLNQQSLIGDSTLLTIATLTKLQDLNLQGCSGVSPSGFSPLKRLTGLRSLNLQDTVAGDEALRHLSQIPRLQILRIGNESISDSGFASLASLISLETLYIGNSSATDAGLEYLGRINRLRTLDIGSAHFTGKGLVPIAQLPELNDFRIRSPGLTDLVFVTMTRAKSLRKLRLVERGWQPPAALTDEGLLKIARATWLTELWLPRNDTGLTEAGIETLQTLMPKTRVISYSVQWDKPEPVVAE